MKEKYVIIERVKPDRLHYYTDMVKSMNLMYFIQKLSYYHES
jgi:hypothetical protein